MRIRGGGTRQREDGAAALEFAIILPVFLLLLVGMIEFGFVFQAQLAITHAAREGARFAAVHDDSEWDPSIVVARAYPLTVDDGLTVTRSTAPDGSAVTVAVTYPYQFRFLVLPDAAGVDLGSTATMRKE